MATPHASITDLPVELLREIARHALKVHPEHELPTPGGHYFPARFDKEPLDLNRKIRESQILALSKEFGFIEVYYHGCQQHDMVREVTRNFETVFQNAQYDNLLQLRQTSQIKLSTFRIDIHCPADCGNGARPGQFLVFTEATLFAKILICLMIQVLLPFDRQLEITLSSESEAIKPLLDETRVCMSRYLRNTVLIRATGLGAGLSQPLTNILSTDVDTMTLADFANLLKNHVRHMQRMLSQGIPVDVLLPLAFWVNKAYNQRLLIISDDANQHDENLMRYVSYLQENNTDILLRGLANYLLSRPANRPHHFMSDNMYFLRFAAQIRSRKTIVPFRDEQLGELREEALKSSDPIQSLGEMSERYKVSELHKTRALINLAVARLLTFPLHELPQEFRDYNFTYAGLLDAIIGESEDAMRGFEESSVSKFYHKISDNPFPSVPGNLTQQESDTYYHGKLWLQHLDILLAAVRCASPNNLPQRRRNGLNALHAPMLSDASVWGPISNMGPGDSDREFNRITFACFPNSMKQRFAELLRETMTEYTLPYYSDPETLNTVHEELENAGLL